MKKYVKPALYCERFHLTEAIVGNCSIRCTLKSDTECYGEATGSQYSNNLFTSPEHGCSVSWSFKAPVDGYCYWPGTDGLPTTFTS